MMLKCCYRPNFSLYHIFCFVRTFNKNFNWCNNVFYAFHKVFECKTFAIFWGLSWTKFGYLLLQRWRLLFFRNWIRWLRLFYLYFIVRLGGKVVGLLLGRLKFRNRFRIFLSRLLIFPFDFLFNLFLILFINFLYLSIFFHFGFLCTFHDLFVLLHHYLRHLLFGFQFT